MASNAGIYHTKRRREVKPQYLVKEARNHPNGFTVYKVLCREPDPNSFDCFKESIVWKRYSDFKDLYKHLTALHRKLYLNGKPPDFAKPKLFGRFEESVVNERKQSAEDILNFATQHPPLFKSAFFKEFLSGLQPVDSTIEIRYLKQKPLRPSKDKKDLSSEAKDLEDQSSAASGKLTEGDLELFDPFLSTKEFIASTSTDQDENWIEEIKRNFKPSQPSEQPTATKNDADNDEDEVALLEDLKVSVTQTDLENYYSHDKDSNPATDGIEQWSKGEGIESGNCNAVRGLVNKNMDIERLDPDSDAREKHRKSSKASAYLESVLKRNRLESEHEDGGSNADPKSEPNKVFESRNILSTKPVAKLSTSPVNNGGLLGHERTFFGMTARSSLQDLRKMLIDDGSDDENRGAYVTQAAQQISFARAAENKLAYEEAFGHYKAAINTLLQGVQGDTNETRIQAVRRKTANYLKRAEDIHSCHLKTTLSGSDLWKPDIENNRSTSPRPGLQPLDTQRVRRNTSSPVPSVPSPRHNSKDLASYKVLGTIGKVILVLDTRMNDTFVLKILMKSCQNRQRSRKGVIPTNVPFMVRLHRYYSTDHAVCLLLEHATGGRLWDHLASYFEMSHAKNELKKKPQAKNPFLTNLKGGMSSTPKKQLPPHSEEDLPKKEEEEDEQCSASFLDLCMEYETVDKRIEENVITNNTSEVIHEPGVETLTERPQPPNMHRSISDAIEEPVVETEEKAPSMPQTGNQTPPDRKSSSEHQPIKRSWSYLSWDDGAAPPPESAIDAATDADVGSSNALSNENNLDERTAFKTIASQGDLTLFTIGQENDGDLVSSNSAKDALEPLEDSIYDSRSNEVSDGEDSSDEQPDPFFHELLSEQDMSAVSLLGENMEKTLQSRLAAEGPLVPGGSPVLARVAGNLRGSPCLSMNSSFEEDSVTAEKASDTSPGTRVVDENGVSSVDAVSLFRTHSRTRSTASVSETKSFNVVDVLEETKEAGDAASKETESGTKENKLHSVLADMDAAKEKVMSYRIPESTIRRWSAEMVVAVGTLHSIAILCRDLNPNNILLSSDGHIRLSYFGKWRQVERKPCDKMAVERMYVAPEMTRVGEKKTEACDWWSVGALLYELMTGQPLCLAHPSGITSHTVLSLPDDLSAEAKSLLSGLLQYHPTQRLGYGIKGLDDLKDHPFFEGIEWDFLIENDVAGS